MYSSNPSDYHKYTNSPPLAPSLFGQEEATTGIPVSSTGQYYSENAPPPLPIRTKRRDPWSSGLFDCFSDVRNCCITCWCPCITFGQISEIVDKGSSSCGANGALYTLICCVTCCSCLYSCFYRAKMRQQHSLRESPCADCLVHCCCEHCALCQEYRELKGRGFDMSIGWHGNVEKRNRGMEMTPVTSVAPTVEGSMSR